MREQLQALEKQALQAVAEANDLEELNSLRVRYLGKKGELTAILRGMAQLPAAERPVIGQLANELRKRLEESLTEKTAALAAAAKQARLAAEEIDITLPGRPLPLGHQHLITRTLEEIQNVFLGMGFSLAQGPEVETDYYNFEALNVPADHPARDMQDSFYFGPQLLLRTHTSPVQVRTMEKMRPKPVRIIAAGRVYRRDDDATHSPMFYQVEGLAVDTNITLADLKGALLTFARAIFGEEREIRLRPSFFPFTEPSAEVDISCFQCGGAGCRLCKGSGWIEILGSGLVHPRVVELSGYDPEKVSGFAFGMGVERIAMLKYGLDDLRHLYTNDMRFLRQF
ncbi:MAG: phenylalanine--tRNA ligase subunit alpha [Firmicutes bacterium]|nr:phenylalanine--tRNA ligase subunit alpha [Bacillota bacterium]